MSASKDDLNLKEFLKRGVEDDLDKFKILTEWTESEKIQFSKLLEELKKPFDKNQTTTKEKGNRLENLVSFIINNSYFFKVFKNVHTATNEIDEVVVFTDEGKQALQKFNLCRDLIPIDSEIFLGECKNYASPLGVTYVGKFYSLMTATGNSFGIIFTQKGLTGSEIEYKDAYGLTKVIRIIEQAKNNCDFYILTFTLEDYEELLNGKTFFEIIKAKKTALQISSDYHTFLKDNVHESEPQVKQIIHEI